MAHNMAVKKQGKTLRRWGALAALALLLSCGSLVANTSHVHAAGGRTSNGNLTAIKSLVPATGAPRCGCIPLWLNMSYTPTLYVLQTYDQSTGYGTGGRISFIGGNFSYGTWYPFAWQISGNALVLQFSSGYTERIQITGYDASNQLIYQNGAMSTNIPLAMCGSRYMSPYVAQALC